MKLLDFLFGKKPNIFDKNKEVHHTLTKSTWQEWKKRYLHGAEYDWQRHEGTHFKKDDPPDSQKTE